MEVFAAVIGSSALAAFISGIFSIITSRQKADDGVHAGVLVLLYDRIKHLGTSYIKRGWITFDEYEDLVKMHKVYHTDLGGNGFLDGIMSQVSALPKKSEIVI